MNAWWLFNTHTTRGADADSTLEIFDHAPTVKVKSVRIEDDWPVKTVEFEVELLYRGISRDIYLPKSNVYRLWFYIKGHGYVRTVPPATTPAHASPPTAVVMDDNAVPAEIEMPQLRDFLFANSQASTTPDMISLLETYLNAALSIPAVRSSAYVLSLLQISGGTFDETGLVTSQREGWLKAITPTDVVLFDGGFKLETGLRAVGSAKEFVLTTSAYVLHAKARHKNDCVKWANQIRSGAETSEWTRRNRRDGSFAMPRRHIHVPYVDGEETYAAMHAAMMAATSEIFIAGWWICPTTYLLRPATDASRLDLVLKRRAEDGVQVYVLMYKEISMALSLDSQFAKKSLRRLHPNIHVLRDPDFIMKQLGLWSHHEKIVCIDQTVAFVGGLDLCFGRWDNAKHNLFEPEPQTFPGPCRAQDELTRVAVDRVGKDYSNPRIKDFVDVHRPDIDLMDRNANPRMPWHDCHCKLLGEPAKDVSRHFIQRWNYSVSTRFKMHRFHHLVPATGCKHMALSRNVATAPPMIHTCTRNPRLSLCVTGFSQATAPAVEPVVSGTEGIVLTDSTDGATKRASVPKGTTAAPTQPASDDKDRNESTDHVSADLSPTTIDDGFACNCQIVRSLSTWSGGCSTEKSIQNAYIRVINDARHFVYIENQFFISSMQGDPLCQNLIANALVSRILRAHAAKQPFRVMVVMPLLPAFQGKPQEKEAYSLRGVMHWQYRSICRGDGSIYHQLSAAGIDNAFEYIAFFALRTHAMHDGVPHTEEVYVHSKIMIVDDSTCIIGSANINERSMSGDRDSEIAAVIEDVEWVPHVTLGTTAMVFVGDVTLCGLGGAAVGKFCHSFRMRLFDEHFGPATTAQRGGVKMAYREDPTSAAAWMALRQQAMANTNIYEAVFGCLPADSIRSFHDMGVAFVAESVRHPSGRFSQLQHDTASSADTARSHRHHLDHHDSHQPLEPATIPPRSPHAATNCNDSVQRRGSMENGTAPSTKQGSWRSTSKREQEAHSNSVFTSAMRAFRREQTVTKDLRPHLEDVQGHIVYFPLRFLEREDLEPKLVPTELLQ
ncbi:hypothetical protein DYB32_004505 [Aphanomyces invadans]|uniref:Phospholipase n=1 Tax=Aphanomyces invadans TaxID=157072 RepID=A0A3R6YZI8_9STRA|nr:hypothetical protein DYB32_004505 [Aphanomyces invadans]